MVTLMTSLVITTTSEANPIFEEQLKIYNMKKKNHKN